MKITDDKLTELLEGMSLEEPSMSFTRNVMDQVNLEIPPVSIKTKVDRRIIIGLASTFIISMVLVVSYAILNSTLTFELPQLKMETNFDKDVSSMIVKVFLFVDLVIGLLYFEEKRHKKTRMFKSGFLFYKSLFNSNWQCYRNGIPSNV
jgi:hypothetical protein